MRCALVLLVGLFASAFTLQAQIISGTLLEAESQSPLPGGVVMLLNEDSATLAQLQADSAGAFSFSLPGRGSYRLRAEHLGYHAATSAAVSLGSLDTLQVEFSLAREMVVLEPLVIRARSRRLTPAARRFCDRTPPASAGRAAEAAEGSDPVVYSA